MMPVQLRVCNEASGWMKRELANGWSYLISVSLSVDVICIVQLNGRRVWDSYTRYSHNTPTKDNHVISTEYYTAIEGG